MNRHSIKDDKWHILNRTGMYLGSTSNDNYLEYIYTDKLEQIEVTYTPALIKMINEIIDNSVDILQLSKNAKVEVELTSKSVKVKDNGVGIPIKNIKDLNNKDILIPKSCWGLAKAGSNFNEDEIDETTIGTNGVGSFCTNVLSTLFIGETCDGTLKYKGTWTDNANVYIEDVSSGKTSGTSVYFEPDFSRLNCREITEDVFKVIKQRLINLSLTYKNIKFYFNKEEIKFNINKLISEDSSVYQEDKFTIAIEPNKTDDFKCFTIVNGLNMKGGSHIDYILNYVIQAIREKLPKKYKDIKPGDIKNKIQIYMIGKNFPRLKFESQTKETLKNSAKEISDYLGEDWKSIIKDILKNKAIISNITEFFDMKADWEAKKALKDLNKPVKKIRIEKYKPAINENKYLLLAEGLSAGNSVLSATGRDNIGLYPLKGKMLNCLKSTPSALVKNQEIKDLIDILNLNLTKEEPISYENIIITTDADLDGAQICSLALTLFVTYRPDLIKEGRIKLFRTPIVISYKKDTIQDFIFTLDELKEHQSKNKNCSYSYKKGLASVDVTEWEVMLKNGIEPYLETLEWSDDLPELFDSWMGSDPNKRKEMLEGSSFNLYLI